MSEWAPTIPGQSSYCGFVFENNLFAVFTPEEEFLKSRDGLEIYME